MTTDVCSHCGSILDRIVSGGDDDKCPQCGARIEKTPTGATEDTSACQEVLKEQSAASTVEHHRIEFTGTASEYFRIWIINVFLSVVSVGIYSAWAKVRTRQYFYTNTKLAGYQFYFLGQPVAILKGNLIIGAGLIIYLAINRLYPLYVAIVVALFYVIFPFLVYKSFRFNTRYSAFRNIRFRFLGTLKESYKTYLFVPFLIPFTLGLAIPYWEFRRKQYLFSNLAYGTTSATFDGKPGYFYKTYAIIAIIVVGGFVLFGFALSIFAVVVKSILSSVPGIQLRFLAMAALYVPLLVILAIIQSFFFVRFSNYCWGNTRMGGISFQSTLKVRSMIWIRITNVLAIIFSIGLLMPWAKIRRTRYLVNNLTIVSTEALDNLIAVNEPDVSALGDAATDFFDIGFGL